MILVDNGCRGNYWPFLLSEMKKVSLVVVEYEYTSLLVYRAKKREEGRRLFLFP